MIQVNNLNKSYKLPNGETVQVLKNINLNIGKGSITAIVGPSGSGKSTLSKCLSLLEPPSSGEIIINGKDLAHLKEAELRLHRKDIGVIFQSSALLGRRTVKGNVALPLEYLGVVDHQVRVRVDTLLKSVGLENRADHYPYQLSGGQKQRVGIARALALNPKIVIADEATSGLDPDATNAILVLLKQLKAEFGLSVILITHEMEVVREIADHVAVLSHGEIVEQGQVIDLILDPDSKIGQKILPIQHDVKQAEDVYILQVAYSVNRGTPQDWLSQFTLNTGLAVNLLRSNVEQISGDIVGKALISIQRKQWEQQKQNILKVFQQFKVQVTGNVNSTGYATDIVQAA